jgi:hypothetical protein
LLKSSLFLPKCSLFCYSEHCFAKIMGIHLHTQEYTWRRHCLELSGWSSWRRHGQDEVLPPIGTGGMQLHLLVQISLSVHVHMENQVKLRGAAAAASKITRREA